MRVMSVHYACHDGIITEQGLYIFILLFLNTKCISQIQISNWLIDLINVILTSICIYFLISINAKFFQHEKYFSSLHFVLLNHFHNVYTCLIINSKYHQLLRWHTKRKIKQISVPNNNKIQIYFRFCLDAL